MTALITRPPVRFPSPRPPPATRAPTRSFAVYYGQASLEKLRGYRLVALQPGHYSPQEILWLRSQGVTVLAYLSVGEDPSPEPCAWSRRARNAEWGTWYVKVSHAGWTSRLYAAAEAYLHHFSGLLLDTLDGATLFPADRSPLLRIVRTLRRRHPQAYLLANRGFDLLPELGQFVDGVLIESFTTSWLDGYRKLRPHELAFTAEMLRRIRTQQLDVFALDYALTEQLRRAARVRARSMGVSTFIGVRELNTI